MSARLKTYSDEFKAKVVLETLREEMTINEIASKHRVMPRNVYNWRNSFLANMPLVFSPGKEVKLYKEECLAKEQEIEELKRIIGDLHTKLEWAKKKSREAGLEF